LQSANRKSSKEFGGSQQESLSIMFEPKIAFITGAARGLGRETAFALARDGMSLFLVDILSERLEATAEELRKSGAQVVTRVLDVSDRQQCRDAVADCVSHFCHLDVLVNCAGIVRFNHVTDVSEEEWNRIIAVNLSGPMWLCQAALPHIIAAEGNIVNVGSSNGVQGTPYTITYSATKAAIINMTKTMAMEYMDEPIRINCVCPGPMSTEIGADVVRQPSMQGEKIMRYSGARGFSEPSEVAEAIAFVASEAASAVNGAIWMVDTGVSAG
jgi:NAD(P)-dependent dehydrogenase (short-subunit alcohol dehydrogenase family)